MSRSPPAVAPGTQTVTNTTGGTGLFARDTTIAVPGAAGATFTGYTGDLMVNYSIGGTSGSGATLAVTIPANSIDFNAVPEPSTWLILATGIVGAGFNVMRVRERRAKAVPAA